jgi:hypothetical protein
MRIRGALRAWSESDRQTLASLGTTSVDHSAAATGFHANQETVSASTVNLGGLVSAFHFGNPKGVNDSPQIFKNEWAAVFFSPNNVRGNR